MRTIFFTMGVLLGLTTVTPALACAIYVPITLDDIRYADIVVVGRINDYRIVRDEAFRRRMLETPGLPRELRTLYEGRGSLMTDYARLEIQVDDVLVGEAPKRLVATWDNSTFGEPEELGRGSFLIALRKRSSEAPPLRGPSATIAPNAEPDLPTLLQAPCSSPFLFESESEEAKAVRRILNNE